MGFSHYPSLLPQQKQWTGGVGGACSLHHPKVRSIRVDAFESAGRPLSHNCADHRHANQSG